MAIRILDQSTHQDTTRCEDDHDPLFPEADQPADAEEPRGLPSPGTPSDIRILHRSTHYENPCCRCDHDPLFPEIGEPAAPEELRERLKRGLSERDFAFGRAAEWFRAIRSKACDLAYGDDFSLRAPMVDADGHRVAILTWRCDEQAWSGQTNEVTYDLVHALVKFPDDVHAEACEIARGLVFREACQAELRTALEEYGLTPEIVEKQRRQLWARRGLARADANVLLRNLACEDHGLAEYQVEARRRALEREITDRLRAERAR